jgi:hypothetical protein
MSTDEEPKAKDQESPQRNEDQIAILMDIGHQAKGDFELQMNYELCNPHFLVRVAFVVVKSSNAPVSNDTLT